MPTWKDKTPFLGPFSKVAFVNPCRGVVVGEIGTILTTNDGGSTWMQLESGTKVTLRGVAAIGTDYAWAVGDNGTIIALLRKNGSVKFQHQTSGTVEQLQAVCFVDSQNGWVVSANGTILATKDGGSTWNKQAEDNPYGLNHVVFLEDKVTGWAVGNGVILHTTNGGGKWNVKLLDKPLDKVQLLEASFHDAMNGCAVGRVINDDGIKSTGKILITKDSGKNWQETTWKDKSEDPVSIFLGVSFVDADTGWVVGTEDTILGTIDGGKNWTLPKRNRDSQATRNFFGVAFPDPCTAYATAANTVLKYSCK